MLKVQNVTDENVQLIVKGTSGRLFYKELLKMSPMFINVNDIQVFLNSFLGQDIKTIQPKKSATCIFMSNVVEPLFLSQYIQVISRV